MIKNPSIMPSADTLENYSSEQLLPLVYEELRRLAASRMAQQSAGMTLQPTALVHEAWLRLAGKNEKNWKDRAHFFRAAAMAMRHILIDRARQKASVKGGGSVTAFELSAFDLADVTPDEGLLLVDDAMQRLEREDPESARIVLLKFFAGLTNHELAATMNVNIRTVERQWAYAKASLFQIIREIEATSAGITVV
jgi:RNA polymerase sigma factor (TIGR02999 family)